VASINALLLPLELDPQVAIRPEPFGALAYHYGNRRLVFLKHPDVVAVATSLSAHESLAATLAACGIGPSRWPSFEQAVSRLIDSQVIRVRTESGVREA
jgi:putative mycofactocin binding protein MftB